MPYRTRRTRLTIWITALGFLLTSCGFHLRSQVEIPYRSLYVDGTAPIATVLRQLIPWGGHPEKLATSSATAERTIQILEENKQMIILAINGAGLVSEYQLQDEIKYCLLDQQQKQGLAPLKLTLTRDMAYNPNEPYAYGSEEDFLYRDMETDAARQILYRIAMLDK